MHIPGAHRSRVRIKLWDPFLDSRTSSLTPQTPLSLLSVFPVSKPRMTCAYVSPVCLRFGQKKYKFAAKELLKSGCNELLRPDILGAIYNSSLRSKVMSRLARG